MEDNIAKWYFMAIGVILSFVVCGTVIYQWHQMDCSLTLGQAGRSPADIREICK